MNKKLKYANHKTKHTISSIKQYNMAIADMAYIGEAPQMLMSVHGL